MTDDTNLGLRSGCRPLFELAGADHNPAIFLRRCRSSDLASLHSPDPRVFCAAYLRQLDLVADLQRAGISASGLPQPLIQSLPSDILKINPSLPDDCYSNKNKQQNIRESNHQNQCLAFYLKDIVYAHKKILSLSNELKKLDWFSLQPKEPITTQKELHLSMQIVNLNKIKRSRIENNFLEAVQDNLTIIGTRDQEKVRNLLKNWVAISKCHNLQNVAMQAVRCKLCEEFVEMEIFADHSFVCFERQLVYREIEKINKLIVKLSTTCGKLRTKLLYPLKLSMSSPKRRGPVSSFGSHKELKLNFSKSITNEFDQIDNNSPILDSKCMKDFSGLFGMGNSKLGNSNGIMQRAFTMENQDDISQPQTTPTFTPQVRGNDRRSLNSFSVELFYIGVD